MKKRLISLLLSITMTAMLLTGCGDKEEVTKDSNDANIQTNEESEEETIEVAEAPEYTPGTWEGTVYTNSHLGFTMTFPDTYVIVTGDTLKKYMGQTTETMLENSDIKNMGVPSVTYDFMALAPDQVSNISFAAEKNLHKLTSEEYGDALLKTFDIMGANYEVVGEPVTWNAGNLDFYETDMVVDYSQMTGVEGQVASQSYLIHADEDYIYYFVVTLQEESIEEIVTILDSIEEIN